MAAFPAGITTAPQLLLPATSPGPVIPLTYTVLDVMQDLMSDLTGVRELLTPAPVILPGSSPQ